MMLDNQAEFPRGLGMRSTLCLYHNGGEVCVYTQVWMHTYTHIPVLIPPRKTEVVLAIALWGSLILKSALSVIKCFQRGQTE